MTEVIETACMIRDRLLDVAKELRHPAPRMSAGLNEIDAVACDDAARMLKKLGTEVTRLRLAIGHFKYGKMSRADLVRIPDTWNDDGR